MGNQIQYLAPKSSDVHSLLIELPYLIPEGDLLKSTKLFKSIICTLNGQILVLAKVYIKRDSSLDGDLLTYRSLVESLNSSMGPLSHANCMPSDSLETRRAGILIRPYTESTLRQRVGRPPNLMPLEKQWIIFQMLESVRQLHASGLVHGDINSENFLLTSWNWVFLADFSSFYKPTYLLEGDLTTYKSFFASSKREACYIAPERFVLRQEQAKGDALTAKMDIFALACSIAEVSMDGRPLFTLATLLSYQRGELSLDTVLEPIKQPAIVELLRPMLLIEPEDRASIDNCQLAIEFSDTLHAKLAAFAHDPALKHPDNRATAVKAMLSESAADMAILIPVITSTVRNVASPAVKLNTLDLLIEASKLASEEVSTQRILPYFVNILTTKGERSTVKVKALNGLVTVLQSITVLELKDCYLFQDYVWPAISLLKYEEFAWIGVALAEQLPVIAKQSKILLELSRFARRQAKSELIGFDTEQAHLDDQLIELFRELVNNNKKPIVQFAMLSQLTAFTGAFASKIALKRILSSVLPLFDQSDKCRGILLEQLPKLGIEIPLEKLRILDLMESGEQVLCQVLNFLAQMPSMLNHTILEKGVYCLAHPNSWVRAEARSLVESCISHYTEIENFCYLRPMILPLLTIPPKSVYLINEACLDYYLRRPYTRTEVEREGSSVLITLKELSFPKEFINTVNDMGRDSSKIPVRTIFIGEDASETSTRFSESFRASSQQINSFSNKKTLKATLNKHEAAVTHLTGLEGAVFSASNDSKILKWDIKNLESLSPLNASCELKCWSGKGKFSGLSSKQNTLFASYGSFVSSIDANRMVKVHEIDQKEKIAKSILLSETTSVCVDTRGSLKIFDIRASSNQEYTNIDRQRGIASALCCTSNALCVGTFLGYFHIFDLRFNIVTGTLHNSNEEGIMAADVFNPDPNFYASYGLEKPLGPVIMAAQGFEAVAWDLYTGNASILLTHVSEGPIRVPSLRPVPLRSQLIEGAPQTRASRKNLLEQYREYTSQASQLLHSWANCSHRIRKTYEQPQTVRAVSCPQVYDQSLRAVLTGSQDSNLRLWNLSLPHSSCILGDLEARFQSQQMPDVLVIAESSSADKPLTRLPSRQLKSREFSDIPAHRKTSQVDAILAILPVQTSMILSASRDGSIRLWA